MNGPAPDARLTFQTMPGSGVMGGLAPAPTPTLAAGRGGVPGEPANPCCNPIEFLPQGLLWAPPLAAPNEARLSVRQTSLRNNLTQNTTDLSIGHWFAIARWNTMDPNGTVIQLDGFATVFARFSEFDFLVAEDYRAGLPITWRRGNWQGKIGYEHVSTHLGDEVAELNNLRRTEFQKDEVALGLGYIVAEQLRLYAQAGFAFNMTVQQPRASRWRFDLGSEWFHQGGTTRRGQPFAAFNANFDGARADFAPSFTVQAGWMWRKPDQLLGQIRIFGEYFNGYSQYGQFSRSREQFGALGIALDY